MRLLSRQQRLNGRPHLIRDEPHMTMGPSAATAEATEDPQAEQARDRLAARLAKTGWPAGSRPSGCGPLKPKSARHDLLTRESG